MFAKDWPLEAIEIEGNLQQLIIMLVIGNIYLSHVSIDEQISTMGQSILCTLIKRICSYSST